MRFPCLLFGDDHDLDLSWLIYVDIYIYIYMWWSMIHFSIIVIYVCSVRYIHEDVYLNNSMIVWWWYYIVNIILTIQWYIIIYICMTHDICRKPGMLSSLEELRVSRKHVHQLFSVVVWHNVLMERILHQLRLIVYHMIYKGLYIPCGCLGFLPSTVSNKYK